MKEAVEMGVMEERLERGKEHNRMLLRHGAYHLDICKRILTLHDKVIAVGPEALEYAFIIADPLEWGQVYFKPPMYMERGNEADDELGYAKAVLTGRGYDWGR